MNVTDLTSKLIKNRQMVEPSSKKNFLILYNPAWQVAQFRKYQMGDYGQVEADDGGHQESRT